MCCTLFLLFVVAHARACLQNVCLPRHSCQHPSWAHLRDGFPVCGAHVSTVSAVPARGSRRAGQAPGRRRAPAGGRERASGADTELREPPARSSSSEIPRCPWGGRFCLHGRPGCLRLGDAAAAGSPASLPRPPPHAPARRAFGRGLCVLCVAESRGRGASPAARCFQSRTRRKAPYQDKSPRRRRRPLPPARPRGRWEALALPLAAFIAPVASPNQLTLRAPSAGAGSGCAARARRLPGGLRLSWPYRLAGAQVPSQLRRQ